MLLTLAMMATMVPGSLAAYDLRTESLTNPLAIESSKPQLSWKLNSIRTEARNLKQSGYRVLVASDPKLLRRGEGDLWDSGRVDRADTFGIQYSGKPLTSRNHVWWAVQVWDQSGGASGWTKPAQFATGLLAQRDWSAQWIHGDKLVPVTDSLSAAKWIWSEGEPVGKAKVGRHIFRKTVSETGVISARILMTADDLFILRINGKEIHRTEGVDAWGRIQKIEAPDLNGKSNDVEIEVLNTQGGAAGLIGALELKTATGTTVIHTDSTWSCDGKPALDLGKNGIAPWGPIRTLKFVKVPAQYFRKPFRPLRPVARATAYVSALGIVDFTVNGKRVSEDLFTPGWTDYNIRTYYRAFDVTKSLKSEQNELGAVLGQGWYSGYISWGAQREHYGDTPMLRAQVEVEYKDGSRETVGTDSDWQVSSGPILDEHFLHGEKYDARIAPNQWKAAEVGKHSTSMEAFPGNPVAAYRTLRAKKITKVWENTYLIDFGQNLSGFVKLSVREKAGTNIVIRHGERLDANGMLYTDNLRLAQATDGYICKGGGTETWNPRFTFHGFQYIEVSGVTQQPGAGTFEAIAISSATPETGKLVTSDSMLNKLVSNAWWTQKMNFIDIPTDCPQRDERLGWTGDAQAYVRTATYFSDVHAFFAKWLVSLDDAQRADGQYPQVAPVLKGLDNGGPAWSDAGVICPMTIYDAYGDKTLLARHYPQMKKFIEFCRGRSKANLLPPDEYHCFGDWLSINADTPKDVISQSYFAGSTALVARAAKVLGYKEDEIYFNDLHAKLKAAFVKAYVSDDGRVRGDTQCGYVLALGFDLLDVNKAKLASAHLIKNIEDREWHLSTGFVGTRDLLQVLSKIGRDDVAYRLLHTTTFPSWGFPIVNGATSIWERWDGWTPDKGFQSAGMNSFSHYAYGAVAGWMFKTIGGISELEPGYGRILIAPKIDPELKFAETVYDSVRGPIKVSWKKMPGSMVEMSVEVPPNVTATVRVPGEARDRTVGSGVWSFSAKMS